MRLRFPLPEPKFKHMDDMEWSDVLAQDHRGVRRAAREKCLEFEPRLLAFAGNWDPGMVIAQHGHMCTNTIYIVEGSMNCGGVECTKGMNITLDIGTPYGPNITGPDGVTVYEVMAGDPWVWYANPEGFAALKQELGIRQLPNPKLGDEDGSSGSRATYDDNGMLIAKQPPARPGGYPKPRFCHADDVEWREVLAQEQNGQRLSAWEKWLDCRSRRASGHGQLRHAQNESHPRLAGQAAALGCPLHTNQRLMDQSGRMLLRAPDRAADQTRRPPKPRCSPHRDQQFHRKA